MAQAFSALSSSVGIGLSDPGTTTRSGAVSESSVPGGQYHQPSVGPDRVRPGRDEKNLGAGPAGEYLVWFDQIERRELVIGDKCDLHSVTLSMGIA
jgi:hypothetical protein